MAQGPGTGSYHVFAQAMVVSSACVGARRGGVSTGYDLEWDIVWIARLHGQLDIREYQEVEQFRPRRRVTVKAPRHEDGDQTGAEKSPRSGTRTSGCRRLDTLRSSTLLAIHICD